MLGGCLHALLGSILDHIKIRAKSAFRYEPERSLQGYSKPISGVHLIFCLNKFTKRDKISQDNISKPVLWRKFQKGYLSFKMSFVYHTETPSTIA
jgi:hypothetical protein